MLFHLWFAWGSRSEIWGNYIICVSHDQVSPVPKELTTGRVKNRLPYTLLASEFQVLDTHSLSCLFGGLNSTSQNHSRPTYAQLVDVSLPRPTNLGIQSALLHFLESAVNNHLFVEENGHPRGHGPLPSKNSRERHFFWAPLRRPSVPQLFALFWAFSFPGAGDHSGRWGWSIQRLPACVAAQAEGVLAIGQGGVQQIHAEHGLGRIYASSFDDQLVPEQVERPRSQSLTLCP